MVTRTAAQSSAVSAAAPTLRHYQTGALYALERELATHRSTLVVAATGTGKTVTFAELVRQVTSRGGRALVLVNRDELVKQTRKKCEAIALWPDVEKAEQRANVHAKVVIASVQTLKGKRLARWASDHFAIVIVDEAHHAVAPGYRAILDHFRPAKVVGFTATPNRGDGKALGEVFETVAYRYEIRQAINEHFLVPIVARRVVIDSIDLREIGERAGDFVQEQLGKAMVDERALRGQAVPLLELASDRLAIAFCVNVAHAHQLAATLNAYRPGCARAVSGETDETEREQLLEAFARREFQFLCNCDVLVEGFDCPEVSCIAICRPTRSHGRFVQCGGRGLRLFGDTYAASVANGKRDCLLVVFGDSKTPGLCSPADCLAGSKDEIADDLRAEIDRLIGTAQLEISSVIAQATDEVSQKREALRFAAIVRFHAENVDPFIGAAGRDEQSVDVAWRGHPPTQKQLRALEKQGVTLSKLPASFTMFDASKLLGQMAARSSAGLCSYKAARRLRAAGVLDTTALSNERAVVLLRMVRVRNWWTGAIAKEPEVTGITSEDVA